MVQAEVIRIGFVWGEVGWEDGKNSDAYVVRAGIWSREIRETEQNC